MSEELLREVMGAGEHAWREGVLGERKEPCRNQCATSEREGQRSLPLPSPAWHPCPSPSKFLFALPRALPETKHVGSPGC